MTTLLIISCLNSLFLSYPFTVTSIVTPMLVLEGKSRPVDRRWPTVPSRPVASTESRRVQAAPTLRTIWVHSTSGVPTVGAHTLLIARSSLHQLGNHDSETSKAILNHLALSLIC